MEKRLYPRLGERCIVETLENGMTVCVVPRPEFSKSYAMCAVNYGGMDGAFLLNGQRLETPAGIAHYLEHKMFDLPSGNALQQFTAQGASPNAFTSTDITAYYFECAEGFETHFKTLLKLVTTPYFTAESVEKERGIIGQEIQMIEDNPSWRIYHNLMQALYVHHPARESVAGSLASIARITPELLYQCHRAFYQPSNMVLCAVGNVDPRWVIATARLLLPAEKRPCAQKCSAPEEPSTVCRPLVEEQMEVSAPNLFLGFKAQPHGKGAEHLRMQMIGDIAGSILCGNASPLYSRLYDKGLINHSFGVDYNVEPGAAFLLCGGESSDPDAVAAAILEEGERIRREGLADAAFQSAKRASYGARVRALNSFEHAAIQLARGVFQGYDYYEFAQLYDSITREDVCAFLERTVTSDRAAMSVIRPLGAQQ